MRLLTALLIGAAVFAIADAFLGGPERRSALKVARPKRQRRSVSLDVWLRQAGAPVTARQFVGVSTGIGITTFLFVSAVVGAPAVAIMPAVLAGAGPRFFYSRQRRELARERMAAWPDALRDLYGALRANDQLQAALAGLGVSGPLPLRPAWQRFDAVARTVSYEAGLEAVRQELSDPITDRVVEVLTVAHTLGGDVVLRIVQDLAEATTSDVALLEKIDTAQVQHNIEAWVVAVAPFGVLVLLTASLDAFRRFYSSPTGAAWIVVFALMATAGWVWIQKLKGVPTEPRVFTGRGRR